MISLGVTKYSKSTIRIFEHFQFSLMLYLLSKIKPTSVQIPITLKPIKTTRVLYLQNYLAAHKMKGIIESNVVLSNM